LEGLKQVDNFSPFAVANLRYFNPIWASKDWKVWEDPDWIPNNLFPAIMKVIKWDDLAFQKLPVYLGNATKDWTWERDYVDVGDLVEWHRKALDYLKNYSGWIFKIWNLWTWTATSVFEAIAAFEGVIRKELERNNVNEGYKSRLKWIAKDGIPRQNKSKRAGDVPTVYCKPNKANEELNWTASTWLEESIRRALIFNWIVNVK
jgi:UDP-glucose 4-epimerase